MDCVQVSQEDYLKVARRLKEKGFRRLLTVSAVDWIESEQYEVYFVVHHLEENVYLEVTTRIPRDDPTIPSLSDAWPNASTHERETWELFGIGFEGNSMLRPLFLEDWVGPPPFRKDFDWREYVKENFTLSPVGEEDRDDPDRPAQGRKSRR